MRPIVPAAITVILFCFSPGSLAADWTASAEFEITTTVVNSNESPWTATIGDGPANSWVTGGAFEPMVFRRKYHARGDSTNEVILNRNEIDGYNTYRDGLLEGATVRVYRVENAAFRKMREDTVLHYYSSDWYRPEHLSSDSELIDPFVTTAEVNFAGWYRKDADYHFKVVAVDDQGKESSDSNVVTVHWNGWTGSEADMNNTVVAFSEPDPPAETNPPAAPANLQVVYDPVTGLMTFTWSSVADPDLAGYRLYYCDRDPAALNGHHIFLEDQPADPDLHIKDGDMIFLEHMMYTWDKGIYLSHRVHGTSQAGGVPALVPYHNGPSNTWALVPHPAPVPPAFADTGQTCLRLDVTTSDRIQLAQYNHAHMQQSWYKVLDTGKTYVAEVWLRQDGLSDGTVSFGFNGFYSSRIPLTNFQVTSTWEKFTSTFTPPEVYVGPGGVGQMKLQFYGPGTVWVDNFHVYEQGTDYMDFPQGDYDALADSGLSYLRTHSHIKSGWGHTMQMLTNPRGVIGSRGWQTSSSQHTLESLLTVMDKASIDPWLQIEIYMDEAEWLGWVEYMAAPYNPLVDTPAAKPWAYKRYIQGHPDPWTDVFDSFLFELSNETWNGLFSPWTFMGYSMPDHAAGGSYGSGQLYGMWQEYVYDILKQSPYWTQAVDDKFELVIGGWSSQRSESGYGQQAAAFSSHSAHMTVAGYNGGWDEGEPPVEPTDPTFFKTMAFTPQAGEPRVLELCATRDAQREAGSADYVLGTYEAGPGYNLNGLNGVSMTAEQVEAETRVMKSLAGGVATLDAFMARAYYGYSLQNFFTFQRNRNYWVSHARWEQGGQAYPCWMSLAMYNLYGTGNHLRINRVATPTWDLPQTARRAALENAPMTAVYATRNADRYTVFVLSRKLDEYPVAGDDGHTPMTLRLPFTLGGSGSVTLHRMTGNPRTNNMDGAYINIEQQSIATNLFSQNFVVDSARGADERGIPPGSIFCYVFEGTTTPSLQAVPQVRVEQSYDQADPAIATEANEVKFTAFFDRPVIGFGDHTDDVTIGGSAVAAGYAIDEVYGSQGSTYLITVGPMLNAGTVSATVPSGAAQAVADATDCSASVSVDNMVTVLFPEGVALLEWEFLSSGVSFYQNPTCTYHHAWVSNSVLSAGPGLSVGDNRYYNDDAYAATHAESLALDSDDFLAWSLQPADEKAVHLWSMRFGAFSASSDDILDLALRWSTNGFSSYEIVAVEPDDQITGAGLGKTAGTALTADLTSFGALQGLTRPIEFRLYMWNASGYYTACGIGKLGDTDIDMEIKGMPEILGGNTPPAFTQDPITDAGREFEPYSGSLTGLVFDPDVDEILSFSKVNGPAWLTILNDGSMYGTPDDGDRATNTFTVRVVDGNGGFDHAELRIFVNYGSVGTVVSFQ